jgi:hypothetical protein
LYSFVVFSAIEKCDSFHLRRGQVAFSFGSNPI